MNERSKAAQALEKVRATPGLACLAWRGVLWLMPVPCPPPQVLVSLSSDPEMAAIQAEHEKEKADAMTRSLALQVSRPRTPCAPRTARCCLKT